MDRAEPPAQGKAIPAGYRSVRIGEGPVVTVVLVAAAADSLARSLAALAAECGGRGVELIAVGDSQGAAVQAALEAAFPDVRFVWGAGPAPGAVLRQRGLAAADGDIVVFADDVAAATPGWLDERLGRWPSRPPFRGAARPPETMSNRELTGLAQ